MVDASKLGGPTLSEDEERKRKERNESFQKDQMARTKENIDSVLSPLAVQDPSASQLQRIESKLDEILDILKQGGST